MTRTQARRTFEQIREKAAEIKRRSRGRLSDIEAWQQAEKALDEATTPDLFRTGS